MLKILHNLPFKNIQQIKAKQAALWVLDCEPNISTQTHNGKNNDVKQL